MGKQNGHDQSSDTSPPKCDVCGSEKGGFAVQCDDGYERWRRCPVCYARNQIHKLGLPPRYADVTLDTYQPKTPEQESAKSVLAGYISSMEDNYKAGRGIILWGSVGSGKTHLGISALKAFVGVGCAGKFITEDTIFDGFKAHWDKPQKEIEMLEELQTEKILMIDDIGVRKPSDYVVDRYEAIFNARYGARLVTILTANRTPTQLKEVYERQMDRMADGLWIEVVGPSGRGNG